MLTYSQKVAKFLEIGCYPLLIPAVLGLLASIPSGIFLIITVPIFIIGVILFTGYFKHSRGNLGEWKIPLLWIGTIAFNLIPLILTVWDAARSRNNQFSNHSHLSELWLFIVSWWAVSIILAVSALIYDARH